MTDATRRKSLAFLALSAILIVIIASALPQLELNPGTPIPVSQESSGALPTESFAAPTISVSTFVRAMMLIILALGMAYCGFLILRGTSFKDLLRPVLSLMGLGVVASMAVVAIFALFHIHLAPGSPGAEILPPTAEIDASPLGTLPSIFIWLAWTIVYLAIVLLGLRLWRWRIHGRSVGDPLEHDVGRVARSLRTGIGPESVIVSCYQKMSLALQQNEGIDLAETMTAREFESLLDAKGIPHIPVHRLTRLFETVRYGCRSASPIDEQAAIDCLRAIVRHTRAAGKALR